MHRVSLWKRRQPLLNTNDRYSIFDAPPLKVSVAVTTGALSALMCYIFDVGESLVKWQPDYPNQLLEMLTHCPGSCHLVRVCRPYERSHSQISRACFGCYFDHCSRHHYLLTTLPPCYLTNSYARALLTYVARYFS